MSEFKIIYFMVIVLPLIWMQHKNILVMGENSYNMVGRSEAMAVFGNPQFRVNSQPTFDDGLVFINSFFFAYFH